MKLSNNILIVLLAVICPQLKALDFADAPLSLLNASVPNVVMMLDDSGSMDWEVLTRKHYDACAYQRHFTPTINSGQEVTDISGDYKTCFYSGERYSGAKTCFYGSKENINNSTVSSIRVRPGFGVKIFNISGDMDVTTDHTRLSPEFDNSVSSIEVYEVDPPVGCGSLRTNGLLYPKGGYSAYFYLYPNANVYSYQALTNDIQNSGFDFFSKKWGDWRAFSSAMNVTYFDPTQTYEPWTDNLPDASFTAARSHGMPGGAGYDDIVDLTGSFYVVAEDSRSFSGSGGPDWINPNLVLESNGIIDIWDPHTIYQIKNNSISSVFVRHNIVDDELGRNIVRDELVNNDITDAGEVARIKQSFANWYQYSRRRSFIISSSVGKLINDSPNYRYSYGVINNTNMLKKAPSSNADISSHNDQLLEDLFINNRGSGGTPLRQGLNTVGSYLRTTGADAPIAESCQQNFSLLFTDGYWGSGDIISDAIGDEDGDSYTDTLADIAHYYYANDLRPDLDNQVSATQADPAEYQHLVTFPVAFGVKGSLEDSDNNGWPDLNGVALKEGDDWGNPFSSNENKINDMWHAAFNSKGLFSSARTPEELISSLQKALEEVDNRIGGASSVAVNSGSLRDNSRVYRATYNSANWTGDLEAFAILSGGKVSATPMWQAASLLDAKDPNNRVIITSDVDATNKLAGVPFRHSTDSPLSTNYQSRLRAGRSELNILGDVNNYIETLVDYIRGDSAEESGKPETDWIYCSQEYQGCYFPGETTIRYGHNGRYAFKERADSIYCWNGIFGDPYPGHLKYCHYAVTKGYGFRSRSSKLGDFVHSSPSYVGSPSFSYTDNGYPLFRNTWSSRAAMIYVGGNDGMLHGFDAATGEEKLAYVPYSVAGSIYKLANSEYSHNYFVDGQLNAGDICTGGSNCTWRTMLTGSLRTGGRAVYALNVTDPSRFTEANASDLFMWEFSSDDDADMGYFFGKPLIVKLANGRWGVIISNGYNSDNGKAILYILDAETGEPLASGGKLDTQSGAVDDPNGLSSPTAVDTDRDGDVDLVYAGDLKGNMWKFDISSSDPTGWKVAYSAGGVPIPLFAGGTDRPVTVAPAVKRHPEEVGYMVYFGTGKYIEVVDNSSVNQPVQSFIGIWDDGRSDTSFNSAIVSSDLLQQSILKEAELYPNDTNGDGLRNNNDKGITFRLTSSNRICWRDCSNGASPHRGWQFTMIYQGNSRGEKQVTGSVLRNEKVVFTTIQPSSSMCDRGGRSWLMELNSSDGSFLDEPPLDINRDGNFDGGDSNYGAWGMVDSSAYCPAGKCQAPSGIMIDEIAQTPTIIDCGTGIECKYISGSRGKLEKLDENAGGRSLGRQSWRELRGD